MEPIKRFFRIDRLQNWFKNKTPKQKWLTIHDIGDFLCEMVGLKLYGDMKDWFYNYNVTILFVYYVFTISYTLWYYCSVGNPMRGLQCTCTIGIVATSCTIVFQAVLSKRDRLMINNAIMFGRKYIYFDNVESPKYNALCEKMISKLVRDLSALMISLLSAFQLFGLITINDIVINRNLVTFLGTELPYFEKDSIIGYLVRLFMEFLMAVVALMGIATNEIAVGLAYNACAAIPDIINIDADELETELNLNGMSVNVLGRIRTIVMKVQEFYGLMLDASKVYYLRLFEGPFLYTYSIGLSIIEQLNYGYSSGYTLAIGNYVLLLICCNIGENLKQANEGIAKELYLLSTPCQKLVRTTIHMLQNGAVLTMGPFGALNFETASDLTKNIYRFTMMLIRMFK